MVRKHFCNGKPAVEKIVLMYFKLSHKGNTSTFGSPRDPLRKFWSLGHTWSVSYLDSEAFRASLTAYDRALDDVKDTYCKPYILAAGDSPGCLFMTLPCLPPPPCFSPLSLSLLSPSHHFFSPCFSPLPPSPLTWIWILSDPPRHGPSMCVCAYVFLVPC